MATLSEKIGQMIQIGFRGCEIKDDDHIVRDIKEHRVGFVVLFDYDETTGRYERNIKSPEQVKELVQSLKQLADYPLFVSIDQEGGKVNRLKPDYGFPATYSHRYLGERDDPEFTYSHTAMIASTLKELEIDLNFAPVVDLGINKNNPIIYGKERTFSHDPDSVIKHARAFIQAHHDYGVVTACKHFPGHGSSRDDTHLGMVDVTGTYQEVELLPYQQLINENLCDIIMTTHVFNKNLDPHYPATLSYNILTGILRDQLHFDGIIITDDLQMKAIKNTFGLEEAIKNSLLAGADVINIGNNMEYWYDAAEKIQRTIQSLLDQDVTTEKRIEDSYNRIMKIKEKYILKS